MNVQALFEQLPQSLQFQIYAYLKKQVEALASSTTTAEQQNEKELEAAIDAIFEKIR